MSRCQAPSSVNPSFGRLRFVDYFVIVYCVIWLFGEDNFEHVFFFKLCALPLMTAPSMGDSYTSPDVSVPVSSHHIDLFLSQHPALSHTNVSVGTV